MDRDDRAVVKVLASALLVGVGPSATVHALTEEFGWDRTLLALADLPEPEARTALWQAVAAHDVVADRPDDSERPAA